MQYVLLSNCDFFPCDSVSGRRENYALLLQRKKKSTHLLMSAFFFGCSNNLFSRTVASQVFSALVSLTSVFGMRTGGTSPLTSPQWYINRVSLRIYSSFRYIQYIPFFLSRQFLYTVDSQLHSIFQYIFSPASLYSSDVL